MSGAQEIKIMRNLGFRQSWLRRTSLRTGGVALVLVFLFPIVINQSAQAQKFSVLYNFAGNIAGASPYGGLVEDADGNLYGTTSTGGNGSGVVFELNRNGDEIVLHTFGGDDGQYPFAGLLRDGAGNLYGTTSAGGSADYGTAFKVDTTGTETVLYNFVGGTTDGCLPKSGLIADSSGILYGTTESCGSSDIGIAFKVDTNGKETVLHNFGGGPSDGAYPAYTCLLMDKQGNFYGVTVRGGKSNAGIIYKLSSSGKLTVLHNFNIGKADGCYPHGTPVMDGNGNLYGTTSGCGSRGYGTIWKLSTAGKETILHSFTGRDGATPMAGVILDAQGNLYGNAAEGGTSNGGTVYVLNGKGRFTVLHNFGFSGGFLPYGELLRDAKGNLYGTTVKGGDGELGTVWKLTP
jgi:uncharacterized repeat protein (TIGR03803 family)